jgi:hypothetical protein
MNNKYIVILCLMVFLFAPVVGNYALAEGHRLSPKPSGKTGRQDGRLSETPEMKRQRLEDLKERLKAMGINTKLVGQLATVSGTVLTVSKNKINYKVNISDKTQLLRRFGGLSKLSEFSVGDRLNIVGNWVAGSNTEINATYIRNMSISKKNGVFNGKVTAKTTDSLTIEINKKKKQTVEVTTSAAYKNRDGGTIVFADIQIGDRVAVRGVWDSKLKKIIEVSLIRDLTIPKK